MTAACPVCGDAGGRLLFSTRSGYPAARGAVYRAWACPACDHRWCVGDVSPALLAAIYRGSFHGSSQQAAEDPSAPVRANAAARARRLTGQGLGGRLLDIGAGNGYFVRAAAEAGFQAEGLELSADAAAAARAQGLAVRQGDFLTDAVEGAFDVITMWDVLSGMTDPQAALARVAALLKPGGVFVATVADGSSRMARGAGRFWPLMIPPVNLHFFSRDSAARLLSRHGLALVTWRHEAKRVSLRFLAQKALRTIGLNRLEPAAALVPARRRVSLDMGDIATLVARREAAP